MSFVQKNYKNGDTLYANDLNNLVSGITEANAAIAQKADLNSTYTVAQVDEKLALKADAANVYTIETVNQLLSEKADSISVYTKSEVDAKLSSALEYKGSVATEEDLPESAEVGDVYNVESTGANYAWNGTTWDNLGGTIDLSAYATNEAVAQVYLTKSDAQSQYATISSVEAGLAEKQPLGDYATITQLTDGLAAKINSEDATALFATQDALSSGLAAKQDKGDYPVYQTFSAGVDPAVRKTIQLANADTISGVMTTGTGVNLVMVSKWDKADFGSNQLPMNLNSKDGVIQINDELTVVDNKTLEQAVAGLTTSSDVTELINTATANLATSDEVSQVAETLNTQFTAALAEKPNADDVYLKSAADTKFALKSDIPTALPNPNALTIKYNGQVAFTYDGNKAETGNFVVTSLTVPVSDSDTTAIKTYIDTEVAKKQNAGNYATAESLTEGLAAKQDKGDYATQNDVVDSTAEIEVLKTQLQLLQDQVQQLKTPDVQPVEITTEAPTVSEPDQNVSFAGQVNSTVATITAKSIQTTPELVSSRLKAVATEDISVKSFNTSGNLPKATANAGMSLDTDGYVTITGNNIWNQTGYNAVEVGLSSAPKSILIDGINFTSKMNNNAISIFDWQENAVITISNCTFDDVSNPLRISNRSNKPCTINIVNCTVKSWVSGEYAGFICMQDYTSGSAQAAQEANQFGKITINFTNVVGPDGVRIVGNSEDLYNNHQIYLYTDWEGLIEYGDGSRFPTITAK